MNKDRGRLSSVADVGKDDLFPPIEARASGHLAVERPHRLYWEESGNPNGAPGGVPAWWSGRRLRPGVSTLF